MPHNARSFAKVLRSQGLRSGGTVYTFSSREAANAAAAIVREETTWVVEWVGPQQFMVN